MIHESESNYEKLSMTDDLPTMETILKQHIADKQNIIKLANFTSSEGEEIIQRVRLNVSVRRF